MATNFRICLHRNSENLHLKLIGDFDGSSACELIKTLEFNCRGASKVFIHTGRLNRIYPFGRQVFCNNLDIMHRQRLSLVFTGVKASQLGK